MKKEVYCIFKQKFKYWLLILVLFTAIQDKIHIQEVLEFLGYPRTALSVVIENNEIEPIARSIKDGEIVLIEDFEIKNSTGQTVGLLAKVNSFNSTPHYRDVTHEYIRWFTTEENIFKIKLNCPISDYIFKFCIDGHPKLTPSTLNVYLTHSDGTTLKYSKNKFQITDNYWQLKEPLNLKSGEWTISVTYDVYFYSYGGPYNFNLCLLQNPSFWSVDKYTLIATVEDGFQNPEPIVFNFPNC